MNSSSDSDSSSSNITVTGAAAASENPSGDTRHEDATMGNTFDDFDDIYGPPIDDDSRDILASKSLNTATSTNNNKTVIGVGINFGTSLVDLYIGPKKVHFKVHKDLLCAIPYFKTMFYGAFKEASTGAAYFPSDPPQTFALFLEWLYTKRCDSAITPVSTNLEVDSIIKLYVFAQMTCLPLLEDCVIGLLLDFYRKRNEYPSLDMMKSVYDLTAEGSAWRRFMAETLHSVIKRPFKDAKHQLNLKAISGLMAGNQELMYDVLVLCSGKNERNWWKGVGNSYDLPKCNFYGHAKDDPCLYQ